MTRMCMRECDACDNACLCMRAQAAVVGLTTIGLRRLDAWTVALVARRADEGPPVGGPAASAGVLLQPPPGQVRCFHPVLII
jgi:hypothetical protein